MHTSNLQISLLDRIYSRLFARYALLENEEMVEISHDILGEFRTEWLFTQMEQWIDRSNCNWMKRLDKACPGLTQQERQLVMLLYLGFSSTSIAFLTGRPSKQAVLTAKCRLRKRISFLNPKILQSLGLGKK
ncbi:MAG: hypothetical protein HDS35_01660 [Bacteroides sp.]|nr:hypothetical protein [Bacteroides sp.]